MAPKMMSDKTGVRMEQFLKCLVNADDQVILASSTDYVAR